LPAYKASLADTLARLGRAHPLVRTQYYSEEIDGLGGLFPPDRLARMRTETAAPFTSGACEPGKRYAVLLDVAGADEGVRCADGSVEMANPGRDATALTLVEICPAESGHLPVYRPRLRRQWLGTGTAALLPQIRALALDWQVQALVIDATGVGAGLASLLEKELPGRVTPFTFNASSKSKLGWDFLGLIDSNRWQEDLYPPDAPGEQPRWQREFFSQLAACQFEVLPGPEQRMKWGVPDGTRDPSNGEPVHDDWVLSAALAAVLDERDWRGTSSPALVIPAQDPLKELDKGF
jgi:hypothetical protein